VNSSADFESGNEKRPDAAVGTAAAGQSSAGKTGDTLGATQFYDGTEIPAHGSTHGDAPTLPSTVEFPPRIGRYEIRGLLGTGGMGVVYRGFDALIEREVAVKVLPRELSENSQNLQRFLAEARAAGKLAHPNTVAIYEVGQEGEAYFLVMELVTGGSVSDRMDRGGALGVYEATRVVADACRGLAAAHRAGMVHRDIKPANLLYASDGAVKVADFGLAKQSLDSGRNVTQAGKIVGTPYFMSPEQCESKQIDHRSDLYSLGATFYCLLTGKNPYNEAGSVVQVMFAHVNGAALDPRTVDVRIPPACSQIIAKATAKRPEERYQTAAEMLADLEATLGALSGAGIVLPSQSGTHSAPIWPSLGQSSAGASSVSTVVATPIAQSASKLPMLVGAGLIGALLLVVAAYFGWAGRGGDQPNVPTVADGTNDDAAGAAVPVVPVPQGEPIRVGVLQSLSGTMAESASSVVDATLLAIDQLNKAGGVLGRPVEALVRDGRSDPAVFARQATKLLTEDKVATVFGCWTSAARKTLLPIFEQHNNLLVYPLQYEGLEQSPNIIYLGSTPNQQIVPAVQWLFGFQGKRKFFIVGSDYVFPRAAGEIIRAQLSQMQAQLVGEEYFPLGSYDVKPLVEKIVAAQPDVILNLINGSSNVPFFAELRKAGIEASKTPTISFSIGEHELRMFNPDHIAGDYAAWNYFEELETPANQEFVSQFRARYGPNHVLTDPMEAGYISVLLWANAVEKAGSIDPVKIRAAMLGLVIDAPEGKITIDPSNGHAFKTPRVGVITADGQFDVVWSAVRPEAPIPFPANKTRQQWEEFLHQLYTGWNNSWAAPN
jgi:urea transport system substrate-binding protein